MNSAKLLLLSAVLLVAGVPAPAAGQSVVRGQLRGEVSNEQGRTVPEAYVVASNMRTGTERSTLTDRDGFFDFSFMPPGEYEVRVEVPGYRPRLVRHLRIMPAEVTELDLELAAAEPPVTRVDTLARAPGVRSGLGPPSGRWIQRDDLARLPDRHRSLEELTALATSFGPSLGSEGLPGSMTRVFLDGVPYEPARHPLLRAGGFEPSPVPRIGLDHVGFLGEGGDVEWSGGGGGQIPISTREGSSTPGASVFGTGTMGGLWTSGSWPDAVAAVPWVSSGWAGIDAHVPLARDSSRLFLSAEGMRLQVPRGPTTPRGLARDLGGVPVEDGALDGATLLEAWREENLAASALARLDWSLSPDAAVTAGVRVASYEKAEGRFSSSPLGYDFGTSFDGTDISASSTVFSQITDRLSLELRAGFERSDRDYGAELRRRPGPILPSTRFVGAGIGLGPDPGLSGRVTKTAFRGGPTVHFQLDDIWVKGGGFVSLPSYEYEWLHRSDGQFFFTDPDGLREGRGAFVQTLGDPIPREFSMPEAGAFAQVRWDLVPGMRVTTGLRYDREFLPADEVVRNSRWARLTGLRNTEFRDELGKFGVRLGLSWDLTGRGTSIFRGTLSADHDQLDPAAMSEVLALTGGHDVQRVVGDLGQWPDRPGATEGNTDPVLALFGPDLEAPRTARAGAGLSQRLAESTVLHLTGTYRRTEFLLRRVDLNRAIGPAGQTATGRPVFGPLVKEGSLVLSEPGQNRRFTEFDAVWGLTADGWSEYQGVTVGLEHRTADWLDLFAGYTFSSTEDNWVGARAAAPGAQLAPGLDPDRGTPWSESTSDFDAPHRAAVAVRIDVPILEGGSLTSVYRFRSGRPFTPGYPQGVDVNGDGSGLNDPAFVPEVPQIQELASEWPCLATEVGRISQRNACRSPSAHFLDLRASVGLFRWGDGGTVTFYADGLNILDTLTGLRDTALLRVDPDASLEVSPEDGTTTIPLEVNPRFGEVLFPVDWGTMVRFGIRTTLR